jgi:hypothetical protein
MTSSKEAAVLATAKTNGAPSGSVPAETISTVNRTAVVGDGAASAGNTSAPSGKRNDAISTTVNDVTDSQLMAAGNEADKAHTSDPAPDATIITVNPTAAAVGSNDGAGTPSPLAALSNDVIDTSPNDVTDSQLVAADAIAETAGNKNSSGPAPAATKMAGGVTHADHRSRPPTPDSWEERPSSSLSHRKFVMDDIPQHLQMSDEGALSDASDRLIIDETDSVQDTQPSLIIDDFVTPPKKKTSKPESSTTRPLIYKPSDHSLAALLAAAKIGPSSGKRKHAASPSGSTATSPAHQQLEDGMTANQRRKQRQRESRARLELANE